MPNQENMSLDFICGCCSKNSENGFIEDLPQMVVDSAKEKSVSEALIRLTLNRI